VTGVQTCALPIFLAYGSAKGKIIENDIYENNLAGIELSSKANPLIARNKIRNGGQNGVLVHSDGLGNFEQNDIYENTLIGFEIREGGNPITERNNVRDNKENFVYKRETNKPLFNW
jgi:parallel beta-helix repeat protein